MHVFNYNVMCMYVSILFNALCRDLDYHLMDKEFEEGEEKE